MRLFDEARRHLREAMSDDDGRLLPGARVVQVGDLGGYKHGPGGHALGGEGVKSSRPRTIPSISPAAGRGLKMQTEAGAWGFCGHRVGSRKACDAAGAARCARSRVSRR
jgi:hypothetical protein